MEVVLTLFVRNIRICLAEIKELEKVFFTFGCSNMHGCLSITLVNM